MDTQDEGRFTYDKFAACMFPEGYAEPYFGRAKTPDRVETYCTYNKQGLTIRNASPLKRGSVYTEEQGKPGMTPDLLLKLKK